MSFGLERMRDQNKTDELKSVAEMEEEAEKKLYISEKESIESEMSRKKASSNSSAAVVCGNE